MYQNSLDVHIVLELINVLVYSVIHFKVLIIRNRLFGFMITILGGGHKHSIPLFTIMEPLDCSCNGNACKFVCVCVGL